MVVMVVVVVVIMRRGDEEEGTEEALNQRSRVEPNTPGLQMSGYDL